MIFTYIYIQDPSADILCDPVYRKDTNANIEFKYGSSNVSFVLVTVS